MTVAPAAGRAAGRKTRPDIATPPQAPPAPYPAPARSGRPLRKTPPGPDGSRGWAADTVHTEQRLRWEEDGEEGDDLYRRGTAAHHLAPGPPHTRRSRLWPFRCPEPGRPPSLGCARPPWPERAPKDRVTPPSDRVPHTPPPPLRLGPQSNGGARGLAAVSGRHRLTPPSGNLPSTGVPRLGVRSMMRGAEGFWKRCKIWPRWRPNPAHEPCRAKSAHGLVRRVYEGKGAASSAANLG